MSDDSILIPFTADIASYEKAIDQIEAKTLGVQKAADETAKRFSNIGKNANFAPINKGLKDTQQQAANTAKEVKKTGDEFKKTSDAGINGFKKLRDDLKLLRGQMADLAVQGKEDTEAFKKLQLQAGALQDQMKDLGASISQNAGDPLENLSGGIGALKGSISSLDFDGVSRSLASLATNVGRVDINTFKDGISGVAQNITKLGAALLTSPIFLVGAAIAGIIAAVVSWGDSMEEIAARNDKAVDRVLRSLERTTAEYDRQIKLQEALGQSTEKTEDKKIRAIIKSTKQAIDIKNREIEAFEGLNKKAEKFGIKRDLEDVERFKKLTDTKFELEQQLLDARNDLRVKDAERQTKADEEAEEKAKAQAEKNKAAAEKRAAEILAAQKALQQSQINLLEDGQRKQRQQIRFDFDERIKSIKGNSDAEIALRKSLEAEKQKALDKVEEEQREHKIELIRKEGKDRARELKQLNDNDLFILQTGAKTLDEFNAVIRDRRAQEIAKDIETFASFGNSLVTIGQSVSTLLAENQEDAAEKNKLFAAFGVGLNLATSLSQMIAGATAAAAQTGALAPFTLVAYIAQGTALVLGAFAQIKTLLSAPTPKAAAKGEEYVQGKQYGKDTEHYMLAKGERVVTSAVNSKYWDELHAMHTGRYDKYINEKKILPALRKAMMGKADMESESFANNIANSLLLSQSWKGGNIVAQLQRINDQENGRHKELVSVLKTKSRGSYRKK